MPKQWIEDQGEIDALFERALVGYLAMSRDDEPYLVPVSYAYCDGNVYFHCALRGRKLDFIAANPRVCFAVHEVDEIHQGNKGCSSGIRYHSAMGFGRARLVTDPAVKGQALRWLVDKYAPDSPDRQIGDADINRTAVVEIVLEQVTGKRNVARPDQGK
ncbi:MAG: pyridoxamine 5'-phosphate oxidase family protein [Bacteroidetes bacterium]|nr:pyridoxamine 5'-phosphate oxidase family protein [Bacteroidota bacterium]MCL5025923.1 pyridoxamine 5'-phosphate oxidase family protein [Chloroflexota bacterium]